MKPPHRSDEEGGRGADTAIPSVLMGLGALRLTPLRTLLSTLGIIIGVASLVAILAVGDGAEQWTREQIAETTTLQGVLATPISTELVDGVRIRRERVDVLAAEDVPALSALFAERAYVWLVAESSIRVGSTPDSSTHVALLSGIAGDPPARDSTMVAGRVITSMELARGDMVATVSPRLADRLLGEGKDANELLGSDLWAGGEALRVVGVTGPGNEPTPRVTVPLTVAERLAQPTSAPRPPSLVLRAHRIEHVDALVDELRTWLGTRFEDAEGFTISTAGGRVAQAKQAFLVFKLVLGAITGISILVGGIGIMNVLLASVSERTREIGIRKAIGARKRDILWQFLAESVAVSSVGSALGVVVGLAGAFVITDVIRRVSDAPLHAAFTWWTPLVAAVAAILVGVAFGTYPATRAARLSPIDAIRHE